MTCRQIVTAAFLSSILALPAAAQDKPAKDNNVDVGKLPVNLSRIQKQLQQSNVREDRDGLNLRYFVPVYGQAPRIDIFPNREPGLFTGPPPYGAPTHRQMIDQVTPQEYRAPAADFSALFRWFADKSKDKK
jgi:hypothetical protein